MGYKDKVAERNTEGIGASEVRRVVDPKFTQLHDDLSECYYDYWKHGESKPYQVGGDVFDVQPTPVQSKALFDKLHSAIHFMHEKELYTENDKLDEGDKDKGLDDQKNKESVDRKDDKKMVTRAGFIDDQLKDLKDAGIDLKI